MNILVFDNYDSFTYNLVHLVEKITRVKVEVWRNDQIPLEKVKDFDKERFKSDMKQFFKEQDLI